MLYKTEKKCSIRFNVEELEMLKNSIVFAYKTIRETLDGEVEMLEAMCKLKVIERLQNFDKLLDKKLEVLKNVEK